MANYGKLKTGAGAAERPHIHIRTGPPRTLDQLAAAQHRYASEHPKERSSQSPEQAPGTMPQQKRSMHRRNVLKV